MRAVAGLRQALRAACDPGRCPSRDLFDNVKSPAQKLDIVKPQGVRKLDIVKFLVSETRATCSQTPHADPRILKPHPFPETRVALEPLAWLSKGDWGRLM